jgi:hypothetical protein
LLDFSMSRWNWFSGPRTRQRLGAGLQTHTPIERPAQGLSFGAGVHSVGVQVLSVDPLARPTGWTCWISLCLAGLVLRSPNSRTVGAGLHNHTPIERPAQGLSFGAGLDSIRVKLWILDPLARPAGWTCWISLCLAGIGSQVPELENGWSRPTQPHTHRKACSRPFVWCRARLNPR